MFASPMVAFLLVLILVLLAGPFLAIWALVRIRRLDEGPGGRVDLIRRIYALEQQLRDVAGRLDRLGGTLPPPPARESAAKSAAREDLAGWESPPEARLLSPQTLSAPAHPGAAPRPPEAVRERGDVETLIGSRLLNRVGILALLFAVAFFLKYAIDNDWIGPRGRVATGLLLGVAMMPWSEWLLRRGYRYFSEGITALGAGVLFLSVWAGWNYYQLFPQGVAFGAMVAVTVAIGGIGIGCHSQRIALLALLGGLLTPTLVSTGQDAQTVLFSYLAILAAGALTVAVRQGWNALALPAFAGVQFYFWTWYATFYDTEKLLPTGLFAAAFFLLFAVGPAVRAVRQKQITPAEWIVLVADELVFLAVLWALLWPDRRWTMTVTVLALSLGHLVISRRLSAAADRAARLVVPGLALTYATLAIPIRLDGRWITVAWAIEGLILVWSGCRGELRKLRSAGLVLLGIAGLRLVLLWIPADRFLWNVRFATFLVVVGCMAAALGFWRAAPSRRPDEKVWYDLLGIAANTLLLLGLSLEVWDLFGRGSALGLESELARQLSLSVLWSAYAAALLVGGITERLALLRWQALALFGLVVTKVFVFDLSFLERLYRILSFLLLGIVLLAVSFLYQRRLTEQRRKGES